MGSEGDSYPKPDVVQRVFREFGGSEAATLDDEWRRWQQEHRHAGETARGRVVMAIAAGLSEPTVRNYFHPDDDRRRKVGPESWKTLSEIAPALGLEPQDPPARGKVRRRRVVVPRIALLVELDVLPSANFTFTLMRLLIREAAARQLSLNVISTHQPDLLRALPPTPAGTRPDGYVLLRLTPSRQALEPLVNTHVPVVLIHGNMLEYEPPVIMNIVRDQTTIEGDVSRWIKGQLSAPQGKVTKKQKVVLVAAPEEEPIAPYPVRDPEAGACMRNERRALALAALEGIEWIDTHTVEVEDYSFHRAGDVYREHPDAAAYVCLSDQIAVVLNQLLAAGRRKGRAGKVLGFDNTDFAKAEGIATFDQDLEQTAHLAIEALADFFSREFTVWPQFEPQTTTVKLQGWNG